MHNINLLPWRENRREYRKKKFLISLGLSFAAAALIILIVDRFIYSKFDIQQNRVKFLQRSMDQINREVTNIDAIKKNELEVKKRMETIRGLQWDRPVLVRVFDEMAQITPDGVYLKQLAMKNTNVKLVGVADSNNNVSTLMRNISKSKWFGTPTLTAVRKVIIDGQRVNEFDLSFIQTKPEE